MKERVNKYITDDVEQKLSESEKQYTSRESMTEIVIGLACAAGTDNSIIKDVLKEHLKNFGYGVEEIKLSKCILESQAKRYGKSDEINAVGALRINALMDIGNNLRRDCRGCGDYSVLAKGAVSRILNGGNIDCGMRGVAYIIDSLKHEDEVKKLREIYSLNFYLFAVNEPKKDRIDYLVNYLNIDNKDAESLCERDKEEELECGQHTSTVFELADFHVSLSGWDEGDGEDRLDYTSVKKKKHELLYPQIERILDLMFGHPYITPTFDEYAMFMAYSSALRSSDLSRQVGAVIASKHREIISTGANEVPCYGGGQYCSFDRKENDCWDIHGGRDYTIGRDPNKSEYIEIVNEVVAGLKFDDIDSDNQVSRIKDTIREHLLNSRIKNLTEFGRTVHAEMAAMLSCARSGVSLIGGTLYCTTFPCHNCARHAVYSGIESIVFIEPYPKSKALDLHRDSISLEFDGKTVFCRQFAGIGPRRFIDLFSMTHGAGRNVKRRSDDGVHTVEWNRSSAVLRCSVGFCHYERAEKMAAVEFFRVYLK